MVGTQLLREQACEPVASDFSAVIGRELPKAYRVAGYILGDATEAQDAVAEAMERAWTGWPRLRNREAAHSWYWQILINVCRTRLRKRRASPVRDLDEAADLSSEDPFRSSLARDSVGRALPLLGLDHRVVIVLRYWEQLTVPEIATRLGIPEGTVKSRQHNALETLRRELERQEEAR